MKTKQQLNTIQKIVNIANKDTFELYDFEYQLLGW